MTDNKTHRTAAHKKAEAKYRQKRVGKTVFFNTETEQQLFAAANGIPNFSGWVKNNLQKYIQEKQNIE